uniref:hypothetical protein n=1 Tax=Noviherbaspirillum sp. TaxID=1926288 RepID=UPI0025E63D05
CALLLVVMLVYPHEILHNQPLGNKGADVQNNSCYDGRRFLRVAASSNMQMNAYGSAAGYPTRYV